MSILANILIGYQMVIAPGLAPVSSEIGDNSMQVCEPASSFEVLDEAAASDPTGGLGYDWLKSFTFSAAPSDNEERMVLSARNYYRLAVRSGGLEGSARPRIVDDEGERVDLPEPLAGDLYEIYDFQVARTGLYTLVIDFPEGSECVVGLLGFFHDG